MTNREESCSTCRGRCITRQACGLSDDFDPPSTLGDWIRYAVVIFVAAACLAAVLSN